MHITKTYQSRQASAQNDDSGYKAVAKNDDSGCKAIDERGSQRQTKSRVLLADCLDECVKLGLDHPQDFNLLGQRNLLARNQRLLGRVIR